MNNIKAQKSLNKIQRDLMRNGIIINTLVDDLKELRKIIVEEGNPLLAKVIRLSFEHIEAYESFNIAIPGDDPIEGEDVPLEEEGEDAPQQEETTGQESLDYLLSLMADSSNKVNEIELREYVSAFNEYAEAN